MKMDSTINIPTINDRLNDFKIIYSIYKKFTVFENSICLKFEGCRFLRQNAIAFLSSMIELRKKKKLQTTYDYTGCGNVVYSHLCRIGFGNLNPNLLDNNSQNSIPLQFFSSVDEEEGVVNYLINSWLKPQWVDLSDELAGAIVGNVWEIFANSLEHSNSFTGVAVCGQHYPSRHELALAIVDLGVSIPGNVRRHLDNGKMSSEEALKWAMTRGNSTRTTSPGGLGLDMLKEFIAVNNAEMSLYSNNGFFRWFGNREQYGTMPSIFRGTIVNLTLKCDGRHYQLG